MGLAARDFRPGKMQHVGGLDIGKGAEHREQFGQVDELRKPGMHPVAGAVRGKLQRSHRLPEISGPGVEMLHAGRGEELRREIALERVHLGHGVGDRRAGGKYRSAAALREKPGLQVHIQRPVALGVGKACDTVHLTYESEVLEQVGLIDHKAVDPQLLECDRIVLALTVGALLELRVKPFLGFLQFLDDAAVVALLSPGLADGFCQLIFLLPDESVEGLVRHRKQFE